MAFVYNDDWAMIERKWFIYKGVKYDKDKVLVNIKGNLYSIRLIKMSKVDFKMWLDNENKLPYKKIICGVNEIDSMIDGVEPIQIEPQEKPVYDNPDSMSAGAGIIWYIIVMVGGLIFKDWLIIWIVASIIFWSWYIKKPKFKK